MSNRALIRRIETVKNDAQGGKLDFGTFAGLFDLAVRRLAESDLIASPVAERARELVCEITAEANRRDPSEMNRIRLLRHVTAWLGDV